MVDDGRGTTDGRTPARWVYYKPNGSGELKKESRISHPFILKQHMRAESSAGRTEQFCSISF